MKCKLLILALTLFFTFCSINNWATPPPHEIMFCGETIPIDKDFVANKLMNTIRRQIPNVNLPDLRSRSQQYFPYVTSYLIANGIPEDFKYLPIIESSFTLETSRTGAKGFWQIMPDAAHDCGLIVSSVLDERDDFQKSTVAACKILTAYYKQLKKLNNVSSWVLTAAAYNFGIGSISRTAKRQGTNDYFSMSLNEETANYVYKIIAVKELFESPELYMKNFGYNVFSAKAKANIPQNETPEQGDKPYNTLKLDVNQTIQNTQKSVWVAAHVLGKYNNFKDGDLISLTLNEDLIVDGAFIRKKEIIKGAGWVIGDRVFIDMGHGHDLTIYDGSRAKGIPLSSLKNKTPVLLENNIFDNKTQIK